MINDIHQTKKNQPPRGVNVDSSGDAAVDPSKNVLDLVNAAVLRLDNLRILDNKWRDFVDKIRTEHVKEIREAEAARIDSIRAVDQANIQQDKIVAEARATTLSNTVQATATAFDSKLSTELSPIKKDMTDVQQFRYEAFGGKAQIKDTQSSSRNSGMWVGVVLGIIGGIVGLIGLAVILIR